MQLNHIKEQLIFQIKKKNILGRPDAVLFRKDEEKQLYEKINEIRKTFTVKESNKDYENLLIRLSHTKHLQIIFLTM